MPFLFLETPVPVMVPSREVEGVDPGLVGVIRISAADLEQLGEFDPPWESIVFWRAFSSRADITYDS